MKSNKETKQEIINKKENNIKKENSNKKENINKNQNNPFLSPQNSNFENQNSNRVNPIRLQDLCLEDKQKVGDMIKKLSTLTADNEDLHIQIKELATQL